jgi:hypothetical protein
VRLVRTKPLALCLKTLQRRKVLDLDFCFYGLHTYSGLDGLVTKKIDSCKNAVLEENKVLNSKCPEHFAWEGVKRGE